MYGGGKMRRIIIRKSYVVGAEAIMLIGTLAFGAFWRRI